MNSHEPQNMKLIKGILATTIGIMFIIFAYTIMLRMILFVAGAILLYYGLQHLNIPAVNKVINTAKNYLNKFLG